MIFTETQLKGSYVIDLEPFSDERGWFVRTYCKDEFSNIGFSGEWVQVNHSYTSEKGTLRGMHYQRTPHSEIKLVRCIAGAVYDVMVDLRSGSATFLKYAAVEISATNKKMMYIPEGFAHGFQTLTDNCQLIYHHSTMYAPLAEAGISYLDPTLDIKWPLAVTAISARDNSHPPLGLNFNGF